MHGNKDKKYNLDLVNNHESIKALLYIINIIIKQGGDYHKILGLKDYIKRIKTSNLLKDNLLKEYCNSDNVPNYITQLVDDMKMYNFKRLINYDGQVYDENISEYIKNSEKLFKNRSLFIDTDPNDRDLVLLKCDGYRDRETLEVVPKIGLYVNLKTGDVVFTRHKIFINTDRFFKINIKDIIEGLDYVR